jgi:hypothetical protein
MVSCLTQDMGTHRANASAVTPISHETHGTAGASNDPRQASAGAVPYHTAPAHQTRPASVIAASLAGFYDPRPTRRRLWIGKYPVGTPALFLN